jgi:hypothetical protein
MREKEKTSPFRGTTRRHNRKSKHDKRANVERRLFEERLKTIDRKEVLQFWVKSDEAKPTDYFIVEFNLVNPRTLAVFKEELRNMVVGLIEENKIE